MNVLFPPIRENYHFYLEVDNTHQLYVEECGNPNGIPVIYLHGGPGSGCLPWQRQFFNPEHYRIILFDQRGCGRSRPHASLENNTTWDLVADIEKIRQHLKVEQWMIFGGSWGSTLGLAYAQTHPERVLYLILRGIFLCRQVDINWLYEAGGASRIFPEYWQQYLSPIPKAEHQHLVKAYYQRLTGDNEIARMQAARAWSSWEGQLAALSPQNDMMNHLNSPATALSIARLEAHYCLHCGFMRDNQLLNEAHKLASIGGLIIHGRYDMVCPLEQAYDLHQKWPIAELEIVPASGHSSSEPAIQKALVQATENYRRDHFHS